MIKKCNSLSVTAGLATLLLLGVTTTPNAADLNNGKATNESTTVTAPNADTTAVVVDVKATSTKKQKSVLDAVVLESPLSIFKDLHTGSDEEDSSDVAAKSSTIVLALKALAATLLSTIM